TYPVTATRYYAAKFLALLLLLGVYLLLLVPFLVLILCTPEWAGSGTSADLLDGRSWKHRSSPPSGCSFRPRSVGERPSLPPISASGSPCCSSSDHGTSPTTSSPCLRRRHRGSSDSSTSPP